MTAIHRIFSVAKSDSPDAIRYIPVVPSVWCDSCMACLIAFGVNWVIHLSLFDDPDQSFWYTYQVPESCLHVHHKTQQSTCANCHFLSRSIYPLLCVPARFTLCTVVNSPFYTFFARYFFKLSIVTIKEVNLS